MIIVSGADLVGKSTFVKAVIERLRTSYKMLYAHCHLGRLPVGGDRFIEYIRLMQQHQVWDRFTLDEIAYRTHDDLVSNLTPLKYSLIDAEVIRRGGLIIVMTADRAVIKRRHERIGDPVYTLDHILQVNDTFAEIACDKQHMLRGRMFNLHIDESWHVTEDNRAAFSIYADNLVDQYVRRQQELIEIARGEEGTLL